MARSTLIEPHQEGQDQSMSVQVQGGTLADETRPCCDELTNAKI